MADGTGGLAFLQTLAAQYLSLVKATDRYLVDCPKISISEQIEDAYQRYAVVGSQKPNFIPTFHIAGIRGPEQITTYGLSVATIKDWARRNGVSVTAFLTAVLAMAVLQLQRTPKQTAKTLRIAVPIDLRKRLPTQTLKNFTLNTSVAFDYAHVWTLASACQYVSKHLQAATEPKVLAQRCGAVARLKHLGQWLPNAVSRWLVQQSLRSSWLNHTLTFSNLGQVAWPKPLMTEVEDLQMAFSPKPESAYSCSAISVGDQLHLTLVRTILRPVLEEQITKQFNQLGISYDVLT